MPETQGSGALPGILADIVATKRGEVDALRERAREIEAAASDGAAIRDLRSALAAAGTVSLIAECKRMSPGAGPIRPGLDPAALASSYELAGAAAVSVLTDRAHFGGSDDDLRAARDAVRLPVLRKDFTLDPLQVLEARGMGADAVLLIARILDDASLAELQALARELGMTALVEVHDALELNRALGLGADVIGINNRDLATFRTDIATTLRLMERVPDGAVIVSESGIRRREDVRVLGEAGVDAVLVGESLLKADDPAAAAAGLCEVERVARRAGGGTARTA